jgi:hypothetical protein
MNELLMYAPVLGIVMVPIATIVFLVYLDCRKIKKARDWKEANPPPHIPAKVIEDMCRAMCAVEGINPDAIDTGSRQNAGQMNWKIYTGEAARFIAAYAIFERYMEDKRLDGK